MSKPALSFADATDDDVDAIVALWTRCGLTRPWNDPHADIALARRGPNAAVLVARDGQDIVASVMVGHDGHRGWFYYLSVDPAHQGCGFGRAITHAAEQWLAARGVQKAMLLVRADNTAVHDFYRALGYTDQPRTVFAKWLDGRDPTP
ncbi:GNAT family acetyltransferase [Pseudolabrys taiwanensis]|uniref:GNAT family acetyltransferase n=1 Tax=Pseudolabrys taiwanensis TaxID=331696 RepID=A0A346A2N0_9HYPH|nr:GNAT family acetyltransferase [Pseudolabrys taiwanensis]AXK83427.1 GNAT family acetyltransferase [Pseudolabrys taiwanensis]